MASIEELRAQRDQLSADLAVEQEKLEDVEAQQQSYWSAAESLYARRAEACDSVAAIEDKLKEVSNLIAALEDPDFVSLDDQVTAHNAKMEELQAQIEDAQVRIRTLNALAAEDDYPTVTISNSLYLGGRRRFHFGGAYADVWRGRTHDPERWYESYEQT